MKVKYLIILPLLFVWSCDCFVSIEGKVISSTTGMPIEGVEVEMIDQNRKVNTDTKGTFTISKHTGFCFDPILRISKAGYKPFEIKIETNSNAIKYSITYDPESFDFDKPIYPDSTNKNTFIVTSWIEKYSRNFQVKNDSLIIYLDDDNLEKEKEEIKNKIKNSG